MRGKIQVLLPEKDIYKKEDQKRLADLFRKLDAEIQVCKTDYHYGIIEIYKSEFDEV